MNMNRKVLIIRFSSFGDIAQALSAAAACKKQWPECTVHWLVREDFADFLKLAKPVDQILSFARSSGMWGLLRLARLIAQSNYTHIYDAHNNLRSQLLVFFLRLQIGFWWQIQFARRSKYRLRRFLFFKLRWPVLPQPFIGALSYLTPLKKFGIKPIIPDGSFYQSASGATSGVVLLPSAAWPLKRWDTEKFKQLITQFPQQKFTVLGGKADTFCAELQKVAPNRVTDLSGQLSLSQSCQVIAEAQLVVGNDTGLLHVADGMGVPLIELVGPSAFGYPFRETSKVCEIDLWCKPCSKDGRNKCINATEQKCMQDLTVSMVSKAVQEML